MVEPEHWHRLLRDALSGLALSPSEMVRANAPGCVSCELFSDFDHAIVVVLANACDLHAHQRSILEQIEAAFSQMDQADFECFNNAVVGRPSWQKIRVLAADALATFGWEPV